MRMRTYEAVVLDATVAAFEAVQQAGYYLHDSQGRVLDRTQFYEVITIGLKAALAVLPLHKEAECTP